MTGLSTFCDKMIILRIYSFFSKLLSGKMDDTSKARLSVVINCLLPQAVLEISSFGSSDSAHAYISPEKSNNVDLARK